MTELLIPPTTAEICGSGVVDANSIISIGDSDGGFTIYYQGDPTHYFFGGKWYKAIHEESSGANRTKEAD